MNNLGYKWGFGKTIIVICMLCALSSLIQTAACNEISNDHNSTMCSGITGLVSCLLCLFIIGFKTR